MRTVQIIGMGLLVVLVSAFSVGGGDIEKCSIKEETSCSGPLHPEDKSYTFSLGTEVDTEVVLKNQIRIYQELRDRLHKEPEFPIYVTIKSDKSYHDLVSARVKEFLKKPEAKNLHFLKKVKIENLFVTVELLPESLRTLIFKELPISRFDIANEAYTEHVLQMLRQTFLQDTIAQDGLRDEQKALFVQYGALPILAAQGLAKRVHAKP